MTHRPQHGSVNRRGEPFKQGLHRPAEELWTEVQENLEVDGGKELTVSTIMATSDLMGAHKTLGIRGNKKARSRSLR